MNRVGISFSTKDRCELSRRSVEPLLQPDKFDLHWIDGSSTPEGESLHFGYKPHKIWTNVRGGADAAIVFALTALLNDPRNYTHIGLVENDVLLASDWFDRTMALFDIGRQDGLDVGAVSARCFEDRILCQRDGYALMHNLGAGQIIFTRDAARIALNEFRTTYTLENRKAFALLAGVDIGSYWAFQGSEHFLCADWGIDKCLALHGYASLALAPSAVEMIGQDPPLEQQGLVLANKPVERFRTDKLFHAFMARTAGIQRSEYYFPIHKYHGDQQGTQTIFPHQFGALGGVFAGEWRLKWTQGFGPFSWVAREAGAQLTLPVFGSCGLMVGGGISGGKIELHDPHSGFKAVPQLPPEGATDRVLCIEVPSGMAYRPLRVTALEPGVTVYALTTREPQPWMTDYRFDHSVLPGV